MKLTKIKLFKSSSTYIYICPGNRFAEGTSPVCCQFSEFFAFFCQFSELFAFFLSIQRVFRVYFVNLVSFSRSCFVNLASFSRFCQFSEFFALLSILRVFRASCFVKLASSSRCLSCLCARFAFFLSLWLLLCLLFTLSFLLLHAVKQLDAWGRELREVGGLGGGNSGICCRISRSWLQHPRCHRILGCEIGFQRSGLQHPPSDIQDSRLQHLRSNFKDLGFSIPDRISKILGFGI